MNSLSARAALTLLTTLFASIGVHAETADASDSTRAQQELAGVVRALNDLDSWFSVADSKRVRWLKEIREKDRQVANVSNRVDQAATELASTKKNLKALVEEGDGLNRLRTEQAQRITEHLGAAYRLNGQDFVKLILNQQSPDLLDRITRYHRYFSDARVKTLASYELTLADIERNKAALESEQKQLTERQKALSSQRSALNDERKKRQTLIAELDAQAEDKESERQRLLADRNRLEQLIAELNRRATELDGEAFARRKGALPWPVNGKLNKRFGARRAGGGLEWQGLVVKVPQGTQVKSIFRGRVVFADWLRGYGLLTIVDHGSGYMTLYGQADALVKSVGDWVESGEVVARAGASGGKNASGLYFELRHKGTVRNPLEWLTGLERSELPNS